jgi:hypothetical protein
LCPDALAVAQPLGGAGALDFGPHLRLSVHFGTQALGSAYAADQLEVLLVDVSHVALSFRFSWVNRVGVVHRRGTRRWVGGITAVRSLSD